MSDMDNMRCAHGVLVFGNPLPTCPHCIFLKLGDLV